jgi:hypothetical protein
MYIDAALIDPAFIVEWPDGSHSSVNLWLGLRFTFQAHSQDNLGVALGQVSECPWAAQPEPKLEPDQTSLDRPKNTCGVTLYIQPDRAWEDLQRRMRESPNTGVPSLQRHTLEELKL